MTTNTNAASWAADDSLLLCASDLQHSAIYDNHEEMKACIRAVAKRIAALASTAAQGVGNSGFDYKTAADFLSGKTVSDEAVRKFVQASRWSHDEKASLSAMLISVRGELASREAEIALLKKALLEAEAAPQPTPAPLSDDAVKDAARYRWLRDVGDATWVPFRIRTGYSAAQVDKAIDAARKQGANQDKEGGNDAK